MDTQTMQTKQIVSDSRIEWSTLPSQPGIQRNRESGGIYCRQWRFWQSSLCLCLSLHILLHKSFGHI
jgi:hypothetical protein